MSYNGEQGRSVSPARFTKTAVHGIGDPPSRRRILLVFLPDCKAYKLRHALDSGLRRSLLRS
jgi:hypothetical protein